MASSIFLHYLQDEYPALKSQYPSEGKHKIRLRVIEKFWRLPSHTRASLYPDSPPLSDQAIASAPFTVDPDLSDTVASPDAPGIGIIVRTDYTNESAWKGFYSILLEAERDFTSEPDSPESAPTAHAQPASSSSTANMDVDMADAENGGEGEEDEEDEEEPLALFSVLNPFDRAERIPLTNISNLTALRLLNSVSIRPSPPVPPGSKRFTPGNHLVDLDGFQEIYTGKAVWIYDARSNVDQCVRLVSQQGDMYGTATADSWRARASHVTELQVNLACGAMKIDFGGLDRWDYNERKRNLEEASKPMVF